MVGIGLKELGGLLKILGATQRIDRFGDVALLFEQACGELKILSSPGQFHRANHHPKLFGHFGRFGKVIAVLQEVERFAQVFLSDLEASGLKVAPLFGQLTHGLGMLIGLGLGRGCLLGGRHPGRIARSSLLLRGRGLRRFGLLCPTPQQIPQHHGHKEHRHYGNYPYEYTVQCFYAPIPRTSKRHKDTKDSKALKMKTFKASF